MEKVILCFFSTLLFAFVLQAQTVDILKDRTDLSTSKENLLTMHVGDYVNDIFPSEDYFVSHFRLTLTGKGKEERAFDVCGRKLAEFTKDAVMELKRGDKATFSEIRLVLYNSCDNKTMENICPALTFTIVE